MPIPDVWIPYLNSNSYSNNHDNINNNKYHYHNCNSEESVLDFQQKNIDFGCLTNDPWFAELSTEEQTNVKKRFVNVYKYFTVYVHDRLLRKGSFIDVQKGLKQQNKKKYGKQVIESIGRQILKENLKHDYDEKNDEKYEIFVKTLQGKTIPVLVNRNTTVGDLKTIIKYREGFAEETQLYIYAGRSVHTNEKKLTQFEIMKHSTLHLVFRLKGGS